MEHVVVAVHLVRFLFVMGLLHPRVGILRGDAVADPGRKRRWGERLRCGRIFRGGGRGSCRGRRHGQRLFNHLQRVGIRGIAIKNGPENVLCHFAVAGIEVNAGEHLEGDGFAGGKCQGMFGLERGFGGAAEQLQHQRAAGMRRGQGRTEFRRFGIGRQRGI